MTLAITPIYAGLAALFFVFLSVRVTNIRRSARVSLGDGGNEILRRRIRVHGNFAEYVPLIIVLMALAELQGASPIIIHLIGVAMIAGRLFHAYGVSQANERIAFRVTGMVLTFSVIIVGALANLVMAAIA